MQGVMLLEALIAILVFSIGILAVVGMQGVAIKTVTDAKYRSEAAFLANDLLSQMWSDTASLGAGSYEYPGSGTVPAKLTAWKARVDARLPGTASAEPSVAVTNVTAQGGTVKIVIQWRLPEEVNRGLPPHNHTVLSSVYANPP